MSSRRTSYAERVNAARLLAEAVGQNLEQLAKVGLDEAYVQALESQKKKVEDIDARQERLKADLKDTTEELNREMRALRQMVNRGRRLVKVEIPSARWKEFGIDAKQ
jgi:hypothetical protein